MTITCNKIGPTHTLISGFYEDITQVLSYLTYINYSVLLSSADNLSKFEPQSGSTFVGSQFDTDVNNKGVDQTVTRGDFCRLLITLANVRTLIRTSSVNPNSVTLM